MVGSRAGAPGGIRAGPRRRPRERQDHKRQRVVGQRSVGQGDGANDPDGKPAEAGRPCDTNPARQSDRCQLRVRGDRGGGPCGDQGQSEAQQSPPVCPEITMPPADPILRTRFDRLWALRAYWKQALFLGVGTRHVVPHRPGTSAGPVRPDFERRIVTRGWFADVDPQGPEPYCLPALLRP